MIIRPAQPIATTTKSSTDRRAVFVSVSNESGMVDLLIPQRTERFGQLRCIYIDTSAQDSNGNGCTIETDLGQNVQAPSGTQGYYPVFIPFVSKLVVSSNETVNLLLLDFDVQPSQWHVANASSVVPNPLHVIVDDQPLATNAAIQNWPAVQPVSISGQPIATDATVQNWPAIQPVSISDQPVATNATVQNWPQNNITFTQTVTTNFSATFASLGFSILDNIAITAVGFSSTSICIINIGNFDFYISPTKIIDGVFAVINNMNLYVAGLSYSLSLASGITGRFGFAFNGR